MNTEQYYTITILTRAKTNDAVLCPWNIKLYKIVKINVIHIWGKNRIMNISSTTLHILLTK